MIGQALEVMLFGMAGIFIVMGAIIGAIKALARLDRKRGV